MPSLASLPGLGPIDPFEPSFQHLLLALLAAHVIGDFVLQSTAMVQRKARLRPLAFAQHGLVHAALAWLLVAIAREWQTALLVLLLHLAIDLTKELLRGGFQRRGRLDARRQLALFTGDQVVHLIALVLIAQIRAPEVPRPAPLHDPALLPDYHAVLVFLTGWILAVRMGAIVIGLAVARFAPALREATHGEQASGIVTESRGLEGGGQMIGALERTLVFLFVLLDVYAGIGFLLTAKSILRFGDANDAKNRRQAEYIIIGTLMSFAWALAVAVATRSVLHWV